MGPPLRGSHSAEPTGRAAAMVGDGEDLHDSARLAIENVERESPQSDAPDIRLPCNRVPTRRLANARHRVLEFADVSGAEAGSTLFVVRDGFEVLGFRVRVERVAHRRRAAAFRRTSSAATG